MGYSHQAGAALCPAPHPQQQHKFGPIPALDWVSIEPLMGDLPSSLEPWLSLANSPIFTSASKYPFAAYVIPKSIKKKVQVINLADGYYNSRSTKQALDAKRKPALTSKSSAPRGGTRQQTSKRSKERTGKEESWGSKITELLRRGKRGTCRTSVVFIPA